MKSNGLYETYERVLKGNKEYKDSVWEFSGLEKTLRKIEGGE